MGSLVKGPFAESISTHPLNILHVCVMPCFDKKLEASRVDFRNEEYPDVDLVISSLELLEMIREHTAPDTTAYNPNPAGNIGLPTSSNFTAERGNNYTTLITPDNIKENKKILSRFSFLQLQQTRTDSCLSKSTRPFSENARMHLTALPLLTPRNFWRLSRIYLSSVVKGNFRPRSNGGNLQEGKERRQTRR